MADPEAFLAQFDNPALRAPIMKRNQDPPAAQPETRER
jgi:hypothetical protein